MEKFIELKRAVENVEMVDAHAHNIVALDSTIPFVSCFYESIGGETLSDSPHPIDFKSYSHSTDDDDGSGSHVHISLSNNGKNVFMASGEPNKYGMSVIGESFMAGVLDHLRSLCVFTMPISNSYERLIPKSRNSSFICWGVESKELPIRVCCPPGAPNGVVTNFEIKTFDGSANPHLGLASIIIAGIDGMRRKLPIPEPVEPESYDFDWNNDDIKIPASLRCSIIHMDSDKWFNEMLGEEFIYTRGGVVREEIGHNLCGGEEKYKYSIFNY